MDPWDELIALRLKLPFDAVFACRTAAWIYGLGGQLARPIEVIMPVHASIRSRTGLIVRRSNLVPEEVTTRRTLPVSGLHRTLRDLSLFYARVEALAAIDTALYKRLTTKGRLFTDPVTARGRRGSARLRRLVEMAEPAESPMETRLRWLLSTRRLPKAQVQAKLRGDRILRFTARDVHQHADVVEAQVRIALAA